MGISKTPNCLYCNSTETIEHVYIECAYARQLWRDTENWVRILHYPHFKISDTEKIFGEKYNDHFKHIIVISIKDVIYLKWKNGDQMCLSDVKRAILKNVHIIRTQELMRNDRSTFDEKWKVLIDCLRTDPATKHSWYTI